MVIGGIETALVNLLKRIDHEQYDVDLILEDKKGEFLSLIPEYVDVTDAASVGLLHGSATKALAHELKRLRIISAGKVIYYWLKDDLRRFDCFYANAKKPKYDIAISYSMHSLALMRYVNEYVEAPIKMVFMHGEPTRDRTETCKFNMHGREKCLSNFDYIFGVSDGITDKFKSMYPQYADRCRTMYNFADVDRCMSMADEFVCTEMQTGVVNILSVGRFAPEKNFLIIPRVCEMLNRAGLDYRWFIVGDGKERAMAQAEIEKRGLSDRLILLGAKSNPYPYYKACDIYCQPSRSEAYSTTINEARMFDKPIVSTEFPGITEQLSGGSGGVIVGNTVDAIASGIMKIIDMSVAEKQRMLSAAAYPNAAETKLANVFFEYIGQK